MGDQNCLLAILVRARPDLAVDASVRVLCVDYLLVKQKQQPQSPRVFSLGFLWVTKIFCYSLSLSLLKAHQILCFQHPCFSRISGSGESQDSEGGGPEKRGEGGYAVSFLGGGPQHLGDS